MKKFFASLNPFAKRYKVVTKFYMVVPGSVSSSDKVVDFGKGADDEAYAYFQKAVEATRAKKLIPVEIQVLKGDQVLKSESFGPVNEIKSMKLAA
ncbi:hypothetical protein [Aureibacter tunicatorum]|uniref:Uncharacterized protein n=1 Tax=Aureibacter tunicatorum TaxID=866807 RepID=A0AAE3XSP8_9BACT|nr:hypothetical protein [Aureibacter tunicatorum]MDR6241319.1 hypothetical protein [Aureibacter tunicatorum]BDD03578.1 hypothetical protein AUTU_10610 [Aureibacter tunicatorum]